VLKATFHRIILITGEQYGNSLYYASSYLNTHLYPRLYGGLIMNEYKHLSNLQVIALYNSAKKSVKDLSPLMATNDRLYLQRQLDKLREEVLRRLNK
jgi:hypothetical protein